MAPKPSPELIARFAAVLDRFPEAERRTMFGFPAAFIGGNLATGLYGEGWMVRLGPEASLREVAAGRGTHFEPMAGRPMKGYLLLPAADLWDDASIDGWVVRAIAYAGALPPKA